MFNQFFTAEDIAEPLAAVSDGEQAKLEMYFEEKNYDVVGYREEGEVIGFLEKGHIADPGDLKSSMTPFQISDLITKNTELMDCLELLKSRPHLFVIDKSEVERIITFADVQKPAVRMLFFGVVTVFEHKLSELISRTHPENAWTELMKDKRMAVMQATFRELQSKNQEMNLLTCTQFADKTGIVLRDEQLLSEFVGLSKTKAGKLFSRARRLRDDLAHAQSLTNWFEEYDPVAIIRHLQHIIRRIDEAA